jgi:hypothetical protein
VGEAEEVEGSGEQDDSEEKKVERAFRYLGVEGEKKENRRVNKVIQRSRLPGCCGSVSGEGVLESVCTEGTEGDGGGTCEGGDEEVG